MNFQIYRSWQFHILIYYLKVQTIVDIIAGDRTVSYNISHLYKSNQIWKLHNGLKVNLQCYIIMKDWKGCYRPLANYHQPPPQQNRPDTQFNMRILSFLRRKRQRNKGSKICFSGCNYLKWNSLTWSKI